MKVEIYQSEVGSPRADDNLGTIYYKHRSYDLGEKVISGDVIEWLEDELGIARAYVYSNDRVRELSERYCEKYIALPLYLYDHSGVSLSTSPFSCSWDSGQVGFIRAEKSRINEWVGGKYVTKKKRERALEILESEIETFNQYLSGDVYGFRILDDEGDVIDSCGGYYGTDFEENGILDEVFDQWEGTETREQVLEIINNTEIEY